MNADHGKLTPELLKKVIQDWNDPKKQKEAMKREHESYMKFHKQMTEIFKTHGVR